MTQAAFSGNSTSPTRYLRSSSWYSDPTLIGSATPPVADPEWLNRTINIDTGCVFGGRLTALRYPATLGGTGFSVWKAHAERGFVSSIATKFCRPEHSTDLANPRFG